jgi:Prokaryotic E2 family E
MLSEADDRYLAGLGHRYEEATDGQMIAVVIYGYELPHGYVPRRVDLLLRLAAGFPDAAPDMFWTEPVVLYEDGTAPPATGDRLDYGGRIWQRWSRHLAQAWRPGIDNLQSYLRLIQTDLENGAPVAREAA